jgi:hypothetical protein
MNRRKFLGISALSVGALLISGTAYKRFKRPDPLASFRKSTMKVLTGRFGEIQAGEMSKRIQAEYADLLPSVPYIGGKQNMFTEWLDYGVYYLAVYPVLKQAAYSIEQAGEIIYRTYESMADYPKWFLGLVGRLKYGKGYISRLRIAAEDSQSRQFPGAWVCTFLMGDGRDFDYGLDITECGICKFYAAHDSQELAPYMCLSDFVVSRAFNRGLVRYHTLAEGSDRCDFRYKTGRETFVSPLRNGWPPKFGG